jgi:hypothetical protein
VQLRFPTELTSEEYINQRAWEKASLSMCPWHPRGGCGFRRHGHYERRVPAGLLVPRWYCQPSHATVSLLPDFAASRLPTTLDEIEDAVSLFEDERKQGATVEQAARVVRPDIEPAGAIRWIRRRLRWANNGLNLLVGIIPTFLVNCELSINSVRGVFLTQSVLVQARRIAAAQLAYAPAPLGFGPLPGPGILDSTAVQHGTGLDPPL